MRRIIILGFILCLLVGCYDQRPLKDHTLILSIGYDRDGAKEMKQTITFPAETGGGSENGGLSSQYNSITVKGSTTKDTDIKMDRYAPENFDRSKAKVVLFGEELAKEGVFTTLDAIYRDLRGSLNAVVAVVEETAEQALSVKKEYNMLVSDFYLNLLHSASNVGLTKAENVQDICPIILTEGKDPAVPHIRLKDEGEVAEIDGLALFSGDKMTGKITGKDAIIYIVLANEAPKHTKLNLKINDNEPEEEKNYVNFAIRNMKRNISIETKNDDITANMTYKLQIYIDEFARDDLDKESLGKELERKIAKELTKQAEEIIAVTQEANHDGFGIGQQVKAYHHEVWEQIDWEDTFPHITIVPTFEIEIMTHGIIN